MIRVTLVIIFCTLTSACGDNASPLGIFKATATGAGPNDVIVVETNEKATLIVAASMDSTIQFFDISQADGSTLSAPAASIFFPPSSDGRSPNPWAMAATDDGRYLVVTLFDADAIALVDVVSRKILSINSPQKNDLKHPTAIKISGDSVFVTFTNLVKYADKSGQPAQYGKGKLARFLLRDGSLSFVEAIDLPCMNPSDISLSASLRPVVACSGAMAIRENQMQLHSGAGLVILNPLASLSVSAFIALPGFSPARVITHTDGYFLSSSIRRQILFVPSMAASESEATSISLNSDILDESGFLPAFISWDDHLAFVADFRNDQIVALDLETRSILPSPFPKPIRLQHDEHPLIFKGPQAIARRGDYLYILMALSSEVIPVSMREAAKQ